MNTSGSIIVVVKRRKWLDWSWFKKANSVRHQLKRLQHLYAAECCSANDATRQVSPSSNRRGSCRPIAVATALFPRQRAWKPRLPSRRQVQTLVLGVVFVEAIWCWTRPAQLTTIYRYASVYWLSDENAENRLLSFLLSFRVHFSCSLSAVAINSWESWITDLYTTPSTLGLNRLNLTEQVANYSNVWLTIYKEE